MSSTKLRAGVTITAKRTEPKREGIIFIVPQLLEIEAVFNLIADTFPNFQDYTNDDDRESGVVRIYVVSDFFRPGVGVYTLCLKPVDGGKRAVLSGVEYLGTID